MLDTAFLERAAMPPQDCIVDKLRWTPVPGCAEDAQWFTSGRFYRFDSPYGDGEPMYFVLANDTQWELMHASMRWTGPNMVKLAIIRHLETISYLLRTEIPLYAPN